VTPNEAAAIFAVFEKADDYEALMWRVDMKPDVPEIKLFAKCNDVFFWATADAEEITAADLPLLRSCLADLEKADAPYYLDWLFAARKRKLRPQKPCYKNMETDVAALFDACCTEAERADAEKRDAAWWVAFAHKIKDERTVPGV